MAEKYFKRKGFEFPIVPQNAQGEEILGSLVRALGLVPVSEGKVGMHSRDLHRRLGELDDSGRGPISPSGLEKSERLKLFRTILASSIADSKKGVVRMFPLVPEICRYSAVPSYASSTWNPGGYLMNMLSRSAGNAEFDELINRMSAALSIHNDEESQHCDDLWARFVEEETASWREGVDEEERLPSLSPEFSLKLGGVVSPDVNFVRHFPLLLDLKSSMTRRKWIAILDSYLRLAMMQDVMWVCQLQQVVLDMFLVDSDCLSVEWVEDKLQPRSIMKEGMVRSRILDAQIGGYSRNSFGLEYITGHLEKMSLKFPENASLEEIVSYHKHARALLSDDELRDLFKSYNRLIENEDSDWRKRFDGSLSRVKNIREFIEGSTKRQEFVKDAKSGFDQGFWFDKKHRNKQSKFVWSPGPVSVFMMVYLNCRELGVESVSTNEHIDFLATYGMDYSQKDLAHGAWGQTLRSLGLIVSSPDADGGVMIRTPFIIKQSESC